MPSAKEALPIDSLPDARFLSAYFLFFARQLLMGFNRLILPGLTSALFVILVVGCRQELTSHPLDAELARTSVQKAMQAWVDGKTPEDLRPEIIVGDAAWEQGQKLLSFEIVDAEETTDGSNLHIRVKRKFKGAGSTDSKVIYIVGTSPVITIFPQ
jgi:hypothetical protein